MTDHAKDLDEIDSVLAAALGNPEVSELLDTKSRIKRERRMRVSPDDGRRKRATGRTKQFNAKMLPELHRQIVQTSRVTGIPIVVMLEEAFRAYLATKGSAKRG
jgi:hypothetical protein